MNKFWWKDEPLIVGSLRWQVIDNDLKNTINDVIKEYKANTTINEAVRMAHNKGLNVEFKLEPNTNYSKKGSNE